MATRSGPRPWSHRGRLPFRRFVPVAALMPFMRDVADRLDIMRLRDLVGWTPSLVRSWMMFLGNIPWVPVCPFQAVNQVRFHGCSDLGRHPWLGPPASGGVMAGRPFMNCSARVVILTPPRFSRKWSRVQVDRPPPTQENEGQHNESPRQEYRDCHPCYSIPVDAPRVDAPPPAIRRPAALVWASRIAPAGG